MSGSSSAEATLWEGRPVREWATRWGVPVLELHTSLSSTNDRCKELAREGAPLFTTVIAETQTAGRGRGGREWSSPPGVGLWMSVLVSNPGATASRLSPILCGIAVVRALADVVPDVVAGLKWPNDILVHERKLCGILCESAGAGGVVAGLGINVGQALSEFPEGLSDVATSLGALTGHSVDRGVLAGRVLHHLRTLLTDPPARLSGDLAGSLAALDLLDGRLVEVSTGLQGCARGIGADGALMVEDREGTMHAVFAGSVRPVPARGEDGPDHHSNGV